MKIDVEFSEATQRDWDDAADIELPVELRYPPRDQAEMDDDRLMAQVAFVSKDVLKCLAPILMGFADDVGPVDLRLPTNAKAQVILVNNRLSNGTTLVTRVWEWSRLYQNDYQRFHSQQNDALKSSLMSVLYNKGGKCLLYLRNRDAHTKTLMHIRQLCRISYKSMREDKEATDDNQV
jgi:hypothetical protein